MRLWGGRALGIGMRMEWIKGLDSQGEVSVTCEKKTALMTKRTGRRGAMEWTGSNRRMEGWTKLSDKDEKDHEGGEPATWAGARGWGAHRRGRPTSNKGTQKIERGVSGESDIDGRLLTGDRVCSSHVW